MIRSTSVLTLRLLVSAACRNPASIGRQTESPGQSVQHQRAVWCVPLSCNSPSRSVPTKVVANAFRLCEEIRRDLALVPDLELHEREDPLVTLPLGLAFHDDHHQAVYRAQAVSVELLDPHERRAEQSPETRYGLSAADWMALVLVPALANAPQLRCHTAYVSAPFFFRSKRLVRSHPLLSRPPLRWLVSVADTAVGDAVRAAWIRTQGNDVALCCPSSPPPPRDVSDLAQAHVHIQWCLLWHLHLRPALRIRASGSTKNPSSLSRTDAVDFLGEVLRSCTVRGTSTTSTAILTRIAQLIDTPEGSEWLGVLAATCLLDEDPGNGTKVPGAGDLCCEIELVESSTAAKSCDDVVACLLHSLGQRVTKSELLSTAGQPFSPDIWKGQHRSFKKLVESHSNLFQLSWRGGAWYVALTEYCDQVASERKPGYDSQRGIAPAEALVQTRLDFLRDLLTVVFRHLLPCVAALSKTACCTAERLGEATDWLLYESRFGRLPAILEQFDGVFFTVNDGYVTATHPSSVPFVLFFARVVLPWLPPQQCIALEHLEQALNWPFFSRCFGSLRNALATFVPPSLVSVSDSGIVIHTDPLPLPPGANRADEVDPLRAIRSERQQTLGLALAAL